MQDSKLDVDEDFLRLLDAEYTDWLEANYTLLQVKGGDCPSFRDWLMDLRQGDHEEDFCDKEERAF